MWFYTAAVSIPALEEESRESPGFDSHNDHIFLTAPPVAACELRSSSVLFIFTPFHCQFVCKYMNNMWVLVGGGWGAVWVGWREGSFLLLLEGRATMLHFKIL